jgi:hypothetical protein
MQEFDYDFRTGANENLAFSSLFRVVDGIERIVQDRSAHHCCGDWRFSMAMNAKEVSAFTIWSAFGTLSM